jgi:hypothetical protein
MSLFHPPSTRANAPLDFRATNVDVGLFDDGFVDIGSPAMSGTFILLDRDLQRASLHRDGTWNLNACPMNGGLAWFVKNIVGTDA